MIYVYVPTAASMTIEYNICYGKTVVELINAIQIRTNIFLHNLSFLLEHVWCACV